MGNKVPCGYRKCSSLSSAKALSDASFTDGTNTGIPAGARLVFIQALGQAVRWRDDGGTPTASEGMRLAEDESFFYDGPLAKLKIIEESASASVMVTYYKV